MSRTARIVLAGVLTAGALVVGGVALAADPAPVAPSSAERAGTVAVQQGGPAELRPAQDAPDRDCPREGGETGAANAAAIRL